MNSAQLIAVVDDDEQVRTALSRVLKSFRFRVVSYASGQEFLGAVAARRPDCVVLDLHMPGLTGHEVCRRLSAARIPLPVVLLTADTRASARADCIQAGASSCLTKPTLPGTLVDAIKSAIAQRINAVPNDAAQAHPAGSRH